MNIFKLYNNSFSKKEYFTDLLNYYMSHDGSDMYSAVLKVLTVSSDFINELKEEAYIELCNKFNCDPYISDIKVLSNTDKSIVVNCQGYLSDDSYFDETVTLNYPVKELVDEVLSSNAIFMNEGFDYLNNYRLMNTKPYIVIDVVAEPLLAEALPVYDKKPEDYYDEQTLEDWYNFGSMIENVIDNYFVVSNISLSKFPNSLSEYIDFYSRDANGDVVNNLINLRLSDHGASDGAKKLRKTKVKRIDPYAKLVSIIVNDRQFDNYDEAFEYSKNLLTTLDKSLRLEKGNN